MESANHRIRTIAQVYAGLMGLLALTACAVALPASKWLVAVSLAIAAIKAFLIFVYFMQLRTANGLTRVVACIGFVWLGVALCLVFADYSTRG